FNMLYSGSQADAYWRRTRSIYLYKSYGGDMSKLKPWLRSILMATCLAVGVTAQADEYPSGPVRLVVPYGPGGSSDTAARLVAEKLSTATNQSFIVENKPGAGGTL